MATDLSTLPFALDYGLENGPILMAEDMSHDKFVDSITGFDLNYNTQNLMVTYTQPKSTWETIANATSQTVDATTGFVWDTAKGTWETAKSGVTTVANVFDDAGNAVIDKTVGFFDGILTRAMIIFGILVLGIILIARSGVLKDIAAILGVIL